jgi:8-oxo-dGTP pyrophosphatase MutT (NUDIX family)
MPRPVARSIALACLYALAALTPSGLGDWTREDRFIYIDGTSGFSPRELDGKKTRDEVIIRNDRELTGRLEEALQEDKPGLFAQMKMVPRPRPGHTVYTDVEATSVKAGVMLLLYPRRNDWHVVFIRRPGTVLHHKNQIGFPGGQVEAGEDVIQAALRETWEEIGVRPETIRILGALTPLYIPPSNFCVYPVVAVAGGPLAFFPRAEEVAEVIEVPLDHLLEPATVREEKWMIRGERVDVPFYAIGHHKIWGATAMVLAEFLDIVSRTGE